MSEIQVYKNQLSPDDIATLAKAGYIPENTPPAIVSVFAQTCALHDLSPFKKEIYLVQYGGKYSTIVGIDGMRAKACRTGTFAGREDARFDAQPDGTFKTAGQLMAAKALPVSCTVTVYAAIAGMRCPFTKTVLFAEYAPANRTNKWASMPFNMIEKCAEAAALRMAFAAETAGLHVEEELAAIQDITIQAKVKSEPITVIPEHLESLFADIDSALIGTSDFDAMMRLWKVHEESTEQMQYREFVSMFFVCACRLATTYEQLLSFYNTVPAKYQRDQELKSMLARRKTEIENG